MTNQFSSSIVCLTENFDSVNIGILDQEEEENSKETKETKELKSGFLDNINFDFICFKKNRSSKIDAFYLISKYKVATTIAILPPDQV